MMQSEKYVRSQIWTVSQEKELRYTICNLDGNKDVDAGSTGAESPAKCQLWKSVGTDELMVYNEGKKHLWSVGENGKIKKKESSVEPVESDGGNDDGNSNENKKKSNAGMIAGIVVVVVVVIVNCCCCGNCYDEEKEEKFKPY